MIAMGESSKSEARNPKQIQNSNAQNNSVEAGNPFWSFEFWSFEFVSSFGFRISDLAFHAASA
jgi:hypothetical protein